MADPTKPETNKDKFAPKNVTEDGKAHLDHADQTDRRDLARGSETATLAGSRHRG